MEPLNVSDTNPTTNDTPSTTSTLPSNPTTDNNSTTNNAYNNAGFVYDPVTKTGRGADGKVWLWNDSENKWTEKTEDDLIQMQQSIYGGTPSSAPVPSRKRWHNSKANIQTEGDKKVIKSSNCVYVQGLPDDVGVNELEEFFKKCGVIKQDPVTKEYKIKIYLGENGRPKGDGVITYLKDESVKLAIQLLDGEELRPGVKIKVSEATFEAKDNYKKKKKKSKKIKKLPSQAQVLSWDEDDRRHVVVKNMFHPEEAWSDPNFFKDLKEEVEAECKLMGGVEKVQIFEFNPDGVMVIKFEEHSGAEKAVEKLNGRFFGGKRLEVDYYDGLTDYHVDESEEMKKRRLEHWEKWLEGEDNNTTTTSSTTSTEKDKKSTNDLKKK
eukprot:TRINITY_DN3248_c0_g1_i1.p1 TRINITY_DN3248_c0_g1~~TRINITY_DN3248_c0_g1_i1.p1  ORF type:complete len:380 (+),score=104.06 TRINITY_DN3248_c0_g1_i1:238-1377(+)